MSKADYAFLVCFVPALMCQVPVLSAILIACGWMLFALMQEQR